MTKDEAAAALVAKRWLKTTKKQRIDLAKDLSATRWENATEEDRAAHGKMLADARARARAKRGIEAEAGKKAVKKAGAKAVKRAGKKGKKAE